MMSYTKINARNRFSLLALILAYICGFMGLACGGAGKPVAGGFFLTFAFMLLITVITLCIINMREEREIDASDKEVVRRLMESGLLQKYMQDVRNDNERRRDVEDSA